MSTKNLRAVLEKLPKRAEVTAAIKELDAIEEAAETWRELEDVRQAGAESADRMARTFRSVADGARS